MNFWDEKMDFSKLKAIRNSASSMISLKRISVSLLELLFEALKNMLAGFASAFTAQ